MGLPLQGFAQQSCQQYIQQYIQHLHVGAYSTPQDVVHLLNRDENGRKHRIGFTKQSMSPGMHAGSIFHSGGSSGPEVWKFDKRFYTAVDDALKVRRKTAGMQYPPYERTYTTMLICHWS